ncbi:MAG: hypothetical protein ACFCU2_04625 [Acidimicrobiia bacterium]
MHDVLRDLGEQPRNASIRVFNHGGSLCGAGGTNFGNDDVRLLVDGVPRAPITWVDTSIDLDAAKDLYFDFSIRQMSPSWRFLLVPKTLP